MLDIITILLLQTFLPKDKHRLTRWESKLM